MRAVQNYSCQDWDAVGVPELEGGGEGGPELSPHVHHLHDGIFLDNYSSELGLICNLQKWSWLGPTQIEQSGPSIRPLKIRYNFHHFTFPKLPVNPHTFCMGIDESPCQGPQDLPNAPLTPPQRILGAHKT